MASLTVTDTHGTTRTVLLLPNITHLLYGRGVGYAVEHIDLDAGLQAISATAQRRLLGEAVVHVAGP